jgi:hypothetical protein
MARTKKKNRRKKYSAGGIRSPKRAGYPVGGRANFGLSSAYQRWLNEGNTGSYQDWLNSVGNKASNTGGDKTAKPTPSDPAANLARPTPLQASDLPEIEIATVDRESLPVQEVIEMKETAPVVYEEFGPSVSEKKTAPRNTPPPKPRDTSGWELKSASAAPQEVIQRQRPAPVATTQRTEVSPAPVRQTTQVAPAPSTPVEAAVSQPAQLQAGSIQSQLTERAVAAERDLEAEQASLATAAEYKLSSEAFVDPVTGTTAQVAATPEIEAELNEKLLLECPLQMAKPLRLLV